MIGKRPLRLKWHYFSLAVVLSAIFLCSGIFLCKYPIANSFSTTTNVDNYVKVDELWDSGAKSMSGDNVSELLSYLSSDGTIDGVQASTPQTAADIRGYTYGGKLAEQSVVVRLGGLDWIVTYVSTSDAGDKIATLWLSNSIQEAFAGRSQTEGEMYGYVTTSVGTGLYSDWSYDWTSTMGQYPDDMYGASYVRAVTLNNGGQYAISNSTLSAFYQKTADSAFAVVTVDDTVTTGDYDALTDFIARPSEMSWQTGRQDARQLLNMDFNLNNESLLLGGGGPNAYDYSTKDKYSAWADDCIWLPSLTELGYNDTYNGLWKLSIDERMSYDGSNGLLSNSMNPGSNNNKFNPNMNAGILSSVWTRSVDSLNGYMYEVSCTGSSMSHYVSYASLAIRPALHLNLTLVSKNVAESAHIAPNVTVGELWDRDSGTINQQNANILLKYLTGSNSTSIATLDNMASVETTARKIEDKILPAGSESGVLYGEKESGDSVVVTLGGLQWYVTYLSKDINGDIIATLWLTNSTQDAFVDRGSTEGGYYGFVNGGLYSNWSSGWYSIMSGSHPSNMYSTSYMRVVTLNNGGQYATSDTAISSIVPKSTNSVFADFTMTEAEGGSGLTEFLVTPNQVGWQTDRQDSKSLLGFTNYLNNDSTKLGGDYSSNYNYQDYSDYGAWGNDYLWLSSVVETGTNLTNGLWGLSTDMRKNYDGATTVVTNGALGSSNSSGTTIYSTTWTRSSGSNDYLSVYYLDPSGAGSTNGGVSGVGAVRPALHLNLSKILYESMPFTQFTGTDSLGQPVTYNVSTSPYSTDIIINSVEMLGTEPASLVIPDTYVYNGTTYYVRSIYSASQVNYGAFYLSKDLLLGVTLPSSILSVGDYAFNDCSNLSTVIFYNEFSDVNDIGRYAFYGNSNNVRYWFNTQTCLDVALSACTLDNTKFTNNRLDLLSNAVVINVTNGSGTGLYAVGDNVTVSAYPYNDTRIVFGEWIDQNGNPLSTSEDWSFTASTSMDIYVEYKFVFGSYDITHISQLFWIAERVSEGIDFAGTTFNLTTDLYLTTVLDQVWQTIGDSTHNFAGTFNGNGYTIYYTASDNATLNGGTALHGNDVVIFNPSNTGTVLNLGTSGDVSLGITDAGNQDWLYPTTDETDDVWQDDLLSKPR